MNESGTIWKKVGRLLAAMFIGIPLSVALAIALTGYCTIYYLAHLLAGRERPPAPPPTPDDEAFSAVLSKLARVHRSSPAVVVDVPGTVETSSEDTPSSISLLSAVQARQHA